jgi:hypothetical protein
MTHAQITSVTELLDRLPGVAGLPLPSRYEVYRWAWAPAGLATRRQLATAGLRPGSREPVAAITWAHHRRQRVAYLYPLTQAAAKQPPTRQQSAALAEAMRVRRTCTGCGIDAGYCLPTRYSPPGERHCPDCLDITRTSTDERTPRMSQTPPRDTGQPRSAGVHGRGVSSYPRQRAEDYLGALVEDADAIAAHLDAVQDQDGFIDRADFDTVLADLSGADPDHLAARVAARQAATAGQDERSTLMPVEEVQELADREHVDLSHREPAHAGDDLFNRGLAGPPAEPYDPGLYLYLCDRARWEVIDTGGWAARDWDTHGQDDDETRYHTAAGDDSDALD